MNRNDLFKTIIKAALTGAAIGAAAVVIADQMGFQRYTNLIAMQQDVIEKHSASKGLFNTDLNMKRDASVDTLLGYAMKHFDGDLTADGVFEGVQAVFRNKIDTMDEEVLRSIMEVVVPIAVMRYLLCHKRIAFNPANMKSWNDFSDKYSKIILDA